MKPEGWVEAEIAEKLMNLPYEEFFQWTYAMMDRHGYRNFLVRESPRTVKN